MSEKYVPLSVREGNRRKRFGYWVGTQRESLGFSILYRLAPWWKSGVEAYRHRDPFAAPEPDPAGDDPGEHAIWCTAFLWGKACNCPAGRETPRHVRSASQEPQA